MTTVTVINCCERMRTTVTGCYFDSSAPKWEDIELFLLLKCNSSSLWRFELIWVGVGGGDRKKRKDPPKTTTTNQPTKTKQQQQQQTTTTTNKPRVIRFTVSTNNTNPSYVFCALVASRSAQCHVEIGKVKSACFFVGVARRLLYSYC